MLVKNENEWCWCIDEYVGYPHKSIEDAVKEFTDIIQPTKYQKLELGTRIIMFLLLMRSV